MSEIVGIIESVGPTIIVEVMDIGPQGDHGDKGEPGNTWKPTVTGGGDLSWAIDSGTTPPTEVNIKGVKGDTGDVWKPTVNASGVISWTKDSSATAPTERYITGPQGLKGDKPAHSWDGTKLQFENPDGSAGSKVDLKGAKGDIGPPPTINYPTLAGEIDYDELSGSLDPDSIAGILMDDSGFVASVKGDDGDTWKPAVNETTGLLTWSKDSGTPSSVNIKGPQGDPGNKGVPGNTWKPSVDAAGNLTWSTASGTPASANIKGPKGDPGSDAPATPVVNALNSASTTSALSAAQGKALNEGKASATEVIIVVKHGTNGNTARPVGASVVYWVGSAEPTKALNDDMWLGEE